MGAKSAQSSKARGRGPARVQSFGLILFGALLVLLFAGFAVAQGIGRPSVPQGDVAVVEDVPEEISTISEEDFDHALEQQVAQSDLKKTPKEGSKKFKELKEAALGELLDTIWIQGEAEELGISVTEKQIENELDQIKKQNFQAEGSYEEFLKESKYTQEDVDERVELQLLSTQIEEMVNNQAPTATNEEIADYYEAEKAAQFTTAASRNVRVIVNSDKSKVEKAKEALEKDQSPANWKRVAKKYSTDSSTKNKGGLQQGISEEFLEGELKEAIFDSATGELIGPIEYEKENLLIEVVKLNPEEVQTLDEAREQITSTLNEEKQQSYFSEFVSQYQSKWTSRTACAEDFVIERCANYVGSGHPSNAAAACYEADPKKPAKECPAPVVQSSPALPGTVTTTKPEGERLPQRPRPEKLEKVSSEEGETAEPVSPTGE